LNAKNPTTQNEMKMQSFNQYSSAIHQ